MAELATPERGGRTANAGLLHMEEVMSEETQEETQETTEQQETGETGKTFTQSDLERIIGERLQREREKYADYDELADKAQQFEQLQEEEMSELDKVNKRLQDREQELESLRGQAREARIRSAVIDEASKKGVVDPDGAYRLLDTSTLEFDDEGQPTNVADAMDELLQQRPYLAAAGQTLPQGNADQGARGGNGAGQLSRADLADMTPEQITKAEQDGRLDVLLGRT